MLLNCFPFLRLWIIKNGPHSYITFSLCELGNRKRKLNCRFLFSIMEWGKMKNERMVDGAWCFSVCYFFILHTKKAKWVQWIISLFFFFACGLGKIEKDINSPFSYFPSWNRNNEQRKDGIYTDLGALGDARRQISNSEDIDLKYSGPGRWHWYLTRHNCVTHVLRGC